MSDEEAFNAILDDDPDNHTVRGLYGDWLQDSGDPRADGYVALSVNRLGPMFWSGIGKWSWGSTVTGKSYGCVLKSWWYSRLAKQNPAFYATRREAEDDAATAFAGLSEQRRSELLKPITKGATA